MAFEKKPLPKLSTVKPSEKNPAGSDSPSGSPLNGSAGVPPAKSSPPQAPQSAFEKVAPAAAFPVDTPPEPKRGPGRPPKDKISTAPAAVAPIVTLISEESVKGLIGMVSNLAAYGFSLSTGAPVEALGKVWTFSDGEKAMLAPPATEFINKSAPEWMKKYETEFKLALIAVPIVIAKLAMTHAIVKMHNENQKKNELTPSPTVAQPAQSGNATRAAA